MIYYLTGEVILWTGIRVPVDFQVCDGRMLSIQEFPDLFAQIGYNYGGEGPRFAVPKLTAPTVVSPGSGPNPLRYLIATEGLQGNNPSFSNAGGALADIRFRAGTSRTAPATAAKGALLQIIDYQPLFALIGTIYGGDGSNTFALPNVPDLVPTTGPSISPYIVTLGYFPSRGDDDSTRGALGENYLAELRLCAADFTPAGWASTANERVISITQFSAVFSLIGINFGGNGINTFGLPQMKSVANVRYNFALYGIYPPLG